MKICENNHEKIVYDNKNHCPLCVLTKHNNEVHDFIESKGELHLELINFQEKNKNAFGYNHSKTKSAITIVRRLGKQNLSDYYYKEFDLFLRLVEGQ